MFSRISKVNFCIALCSVLMSVSIFASPKAVIETTEGTIEVTLKPDIAPKACENFMALSKKGYYDGTTFHRILKHFMIQGGDPKGNGTGGTSMWGRPFEDELSSKQRFDRPLLLAMANAGPNTNGSQFFITTVKTPWLNNKHTIFGEVTHGSETVFIIEKFGSTSGVPQKKIQVKSIKIERDSL